MTKKHVAEGVAVVIATLVVGLFFVWRGPFTFFALQSEAPASEEASALGGLRDSPDLVVQDIQVGNGETAEAGKILTVHYAGVLSDGTVFDNSVARGQPIVFQLGRGEVIDGWEEGLVGMREGGRRVLIIPPHLGYGARQVGSIPPNSTLIFEVVLIDVSDPAGQ